MNWLIISVSLFILFILIEEIIYFYLRTRVIHYHPKKEKEMVSDGRIKIWYYKVKHKLTHSQ